MFYIYIVYYVYIRRVQMREILYLHKWAPNSNIPISQSYCSTA